MVVRLFFEKRVRLKNPFVVEGLPGLGLVGKLAVDHLISETRAKRFLTGFSYDFPPSVVISPEGDIRMPVFEFYYYKKGKKQFIFITGDHQGMVPSAQYEISEEIVKLTKKYDSKLIFTLGGYGVGVVVRKPKVFGAVNNLKLKKKLEKLGVEFNRQGTNIIGAAGLILGISKFCDIPAACLMGETHGNYVDPKAARSVLNVVCDYLGLKVDFSELDKKAKEIENILNNLVKEHEKAQVPEEKLPYIR